jgi:hypothetical protein
VNGCACCWRSRCFGCLIPSHFSSKGLFDYGVGRSCCGQSYNRVDVPSRLASHRANRRLIACASMQVNTVYCKIPSKMSQSNLIIMSKILNRCIILICIDMHKLPSNPCTEIGRQDHRPGHDQDGRQEHASGEWLMAGAGFF